MNREEQTSRTRSLTSGSIDFSEIRIENTNRCGYHCFFCPREALQREQGFMSIEDLAIVIDKVGNHRGLVDLHGFGEPLLDKLLPAKIALVTSRWPLARSRFFSTLGVKLPPNYFEQLVVAGLSLVEVSFYGFDRESYREAHGVDRYELARANLVQLCEAQKLSAEKFQVVVRAFPKHQHIMQPGTTSQRREEFRLWLEDLGVRVVRERELHNYGNGRSYNKSGINRACSIVWGYRRRILQITWDLNIIPCCFDFDGKMKLGNLRTQSLVEIFAGARYTNFINSHIENRLEQYPVCESCERCFRA